MTDCDVWDAFGDDDEISDVEDPVVMEGVSFLVMNFVKHNPQLRVSQRFVATTSSVWKDALEQRGINLSQSAGPCDAVILNEEDNDAFDILKRVIPGGHLLVISRLSNFPTQYNLHEAVWRKEILVAMSEDVKLWSIQRASCPININSCSWKPTYPHTKKDTEFHHERELLEEATITRSAYELKHKTPSLTPHGIDQAVESLNKNGYCIIRSLLDVERCSQWGQAVLNDFKSAAEILLERDLIDLYNPQDSACDPQTYRELSMREDLRLDLRDGPCLREMREQERKECVLIPYNASESHVPFILSSKREGSGNSCLRFHPNVIEIVRKTLNPTITNLFKGNFGRFNFDGGGPDGSPQNLRVGPMGGIVSLPGSADQAIHADTPHLFETIDCLPAHYINAFCLGAEAQCIKDCYGFSTGATSVGGTAFVHTSHKLSFTASLENGWTTTTEPQVLQNLVRPSLKIGDLVLFDCRILHFGLANTSRSVIRPMLYTNMSQAWFHDPKNWDEEKSIFPAGNRGKANKLGS
mmetsp:Transcript_18213/g.21029  ORF Transcript_18213/g.21029 Transcript_18213/m.21029 type:complete len:525 (+) Transcript_18213:20-1594(+)